MEQVTSSRSRSFRVLLDHACEWALGNAPNAVTLTTFANIPWNAPYYERCGFRRLPANDLTPGLLRIRREEADHGLDAWPRVCMRRVLAEPNILDQR